MEDMIVDLHAKSRSEIIANFLTCVRGSGPLVVCVSDRNVTSKRIPLISVLLFILSDVKHQIKKVSP